MLCDEIEELKLEERWRSISRPDLTTSSSPNLTTPAMWRNEGR